MTTRRLRDLGIVVGALPTGPHNAITDVPGVRVGHTTVVEGDDVRTGVTAVVPGQLEHRPALPAAIEVGNGYGKLVGYTQVAELGEIETPVLLTGTLSTFRAADALVTYMLARPGHDHLQSVNPVVAETNDGLLSDIRRRPVTETHVLSALHEAAAGPVAEGAVGAGTGTGALGFKSGIGTSSRRSPTSRGEATVGVLTQTNFSGTLRLSGRDITPESMGLPTPPPHRGNSCVLVVATDAALDARQLSRLARRAIFTLGRVGSDYAPGSGDYAIAFSTASTPSSPAGDPPGLPVPLPEADLAGLFTAVMEAAEEAVLNSLTAARTTTGRAGNTRYALPHDRLLALLNTPTTGP